MVVGRHGASGRHAQLPVKVLATQDERATSIGNEHVQTPLHRMMGRNVREKPRTENCVAPSVQVSKKKLTKCFYTKKGLKVIIFQRFPKSGFSNNDYKGHILIV